MRHAWIEIDLNALRYNLSAFRKILSPGSDIMCIIKANAYGHGAVPLASTLREEGVVHFGVALVQEGVELRASGVSESILVLGHTPDEDLQDAVKYNLTLTIFTLEQAISLDEAARGLERRARVHLKVDTGMGRIGFIPGREALRDIAKIVRLPNLEVEGIYSHLAWADNPDGAYTHTQFERFQRFLDDLANEGIRFEKVHLANSAAAINYPETHFDLVRMGISLYGLYPDPSMAISPKIDLRPVMSIKARLSFVKEVPEGTAISYGCTFVTRRPSLIGTVPMGYADGIPRLLSNRGEVLVEGTRCPIVGRVCMDQFMIDLTDLPERPAAGEEVVFLGKQGKEIISADEIAEKAETINYEIVTRTSLRLPRIYVNGELT